MYAYDWLIAITNTSEAQHVQIDLCNKTIFYKGRPLVAKGVILFPVTLATNELVSVVCLEGLIDFMSDPYEEIEHLFALYKRSVPSTHDRLGRGSFKGCSADQLSYRELENNVSRQEARLRLESFVLLTASAGLLQWKNPAHFFWRGKDPDLILYREWVL